MPAVAKPSPSAGWRDSALTSHGVLQAGRLASHLVARATSIGPIKHIFSSDLQRAFKTAEAICEAQNNTAGSLPVHNGVVRASELREWNYRSAEGRSFRDRSSRGSFDDAESHEEMRARVNRFIETLLRPVLAGNPPGELADHSVVVVAHGVILGVLLGSLLLKFPSAANGTRESKQLAEGLIQWRNTGYLEALVRHDSVAAAPLSAPNPSADATLLSPNDPAESIPGPGQGTVALAVTAVNCVDHLQGLKKTKGGIGSAKFDDKQKTMDSFFGSSKKPDAERGNAC